MTLKQVRSDKALTAWFSRIFEDKRFQVIWKMMNDSHPLRHTEGLQVTKSSAENRLGEIQGYQLSLDYLLSCTQHQPDDKPLPDPTFAAPELPEQPTES